MVFTREGLETITHEPAVVLQGARLLVGTLNLPWQLVVRLGAKVMKVLWFLRVLHP